MSLLRQLLGDPWSGKGQKCPGCDSLYFFDGPHGGAAVNVKCAMCGRCYWYGPPFKEIEDCGLYGKQARRLEDIL